MEIKNLNTILIHKQYIYDTCIAISSYLYRFTLLSFITPFQSIPKAKS